MPIIQQPLSAKNTPKLSSKWRSDLSFGEKKSRFKRRLQFHKKRYPIFYSFCDAKKTYRSSLMEKFA